MPMWKISNYILKRSLVTAAEKKYERNEDNESHSFQWLCNGQFQCTFFLRLGLSCNAFTFRDIVSMITCMHANTVILNLLRLPSEPILSPRESQFRFILSEKLMPYNRSWCPLRFHFDFLLLWTITNRNTTLLPTALDYGRSGFYIMYKCFIRG